MWVQVIRANVRSLNGNVYPEEVLKQVASGLTPCKLYRQYGRFTDDGVTHEAAPVAEATAFLYEKGWLLANLEGLSDTDRDTLLAGGKVVRAAAVATFAPPPVEGQLVVKVERMDHLALCDPEDASWCVGMTCKSSSVVSPSPA